MELSEASQSIARAHAAAHATDWTVFRYLTVTQSGEKQIAGFDVGSLIETLRSTDHEQAIDIARLCFEISLNASLAPGGEKWTATAIRFLVTIMLLRRGFDFDAEAAEFARRIKLSLNKAGQQRYLHAITDEVNLLESESSRDKILASINRLFRAGAASDGTTGLGLGRQRKRQHELDRLWCERHDTSQSSEPVDCSVFGPRAAAPGAMVTIQVYLHVPADLAEARALAQEIDPAAVRRGTGPLSVELAIGDFVTLDLELTGATVRGAEFSDKGSPPVGRKLLRWSGRSTGANFIVDIDQYHDGPVVGRVVVSREDAPVGTVYFTIEAQAADQAESRSEQIGSGKRFELVFVSYASEDRSEVLRRVQVLEALGIKFFQDLISLAPGERWERSIEGALEACDGFFLFWSSAAKASEWVKRELQYAIDRKKGIADNPPEIIPIAVEGPPPPAPPESLEEIQLGSRIMYFMPQWHAVANKKGVVKCPGCGLRFPLGGSTWDGNRHLRCGTAIVLNSGQ